MSSAYNKSPLRPKLHDFDASHKLHVQQLKSYEESADQEKPVDTHQAMLKRACLLEDTSPTLQKTTLPVDKAELQEFELKKEESALQLSRPPSSTHNEFVMATDQDINPQISEIQFGRGRRKRKLPSRYICELPDLTHFRGKTNRYLDLGARNSSEEISMGGDYYLDEVDRDTECESLENAAEILMEMKGNFGEEILDIPELGGKKSLEERINLQKVPDSRQNNAEEIIDLTLSDDESQEDIAQKRRSFEKIGPAPPIEGHSGGSSSSAMATIAYGPRPIAVSIAAAPQPPIHIEYPIPFSTIGPIVQPGPISTLVCAQITQENNLTSKKSLANKKKKFKKATTMRYAHGEEEQLLMTKARAILKKVGIPRDKAVNHIASLVGRPTPGHHDQGLGPNSNAFKRSRLEEHATLLALQTVIKKNSLRVSAFPFTWISPRDVVEG